MNFRRPRPPMTNPNKNESIWIDETRCYRILMRSETKTKSEQSGEGYFVIRNDQRNTRKSLLIDHFFYDFVLLFFLSSARPLLNSIHIDATHETAYCRLKLFICSTQSPFDTQKTKPKKEETRTEKKSQEIVIYLCRRRRHWTRPKSLITAYLHFKNVFTFHLYASNAINFRSSDDNENWKKKLHFCRRDFVDRRR